MRIIENEFLKLTVSDHGAEPQSIIKKSDNSEILWCGDPKYWNRHAPVLFPFVGKVQGGHYRIGEYKYPMGQHGFARDMDFECLGQTENSVTHRLASTDETREKYPFDFLFDVTHTLDKNTVKIGWTVKNPSDEKILYFSVGGHPAFNCPVNAIGEKTDYQLWFDCQNNPTFYLIDPVTEGVDIEKPHTLKLNDGRISVSEELFANDAMIFDGQITKLGLLYPNGKPYIMLNCPDALSVGIWSKPDSSAPYICLEPWIGRCDNKGFSGELSEKFGEQSLNFGETFYSEYSIEIN